MRRYRIKIDGRVVAEPESREQALTCALNALIARGGSVNEQGETASFAVIEACDGIHGTPALERFGVRRVTRGDLPCWELVPRPFVPVVLRLDGVQLGRYASLEMALELGPNLTWPGCERGDKVARIEDENGRLLGEYVTRIVPQRAVFIDARTVRLGMSSTAAA